MICICVYVCVWVWGFSVRSTSLASVGDVANVAALMCDHRCISGFSWLLTETLLQLRWRLHESLAGSGLEKGRKTRRDGKGYRSLTQALRCHYQLSAGS